MFIDQAKIKVKAGDGGDGIVSFHRDKLHPKGIPDGGNGGNGANVVFTVDEGMNTLQQYKYKPFFKAQGGMRGGSNKKNGKNGGDLILSVPPGTILKDEENKVLFDLASKGQRYVIAKGGLGGRGNASFATAKHKAPKFAMKGEPGEEIPVVLELKVLADVGIVGFPNVGKSTFISVISKAKPKIADYPFTTITPNLGVVETVEGFTYVVADIPGLIEGAHKGKGLGDTFLKHVERAGILVHMLDAGSKDPNKDYEVLNKELVLYSQELAKKKQIVVLNKIDLEARGERRETIKKIFKKKKVPFFEISALKKQGLSPLIEFIGSEAKKSKKHLPENRETIYRIKEKESLAGFQIDKEEGIYKVKGKVIERLVKMTDFNNEEAVKYLHSQFKKARLDENLTKKGAKEGETIEIAGKQFDFTPGLTE